MINKYLKNLRRIEFVVTDACTGKCKHCSQGEHSKNGCLDKNKAADVIRKISRIYNINSVMTFGGEALLFPDVVCEIHKAAKENGIFNRQLITNGYFSEDKQKIKYVADQLTDSGVNEILLSVDAFHQETIPVEYVRLFAEEIMKNNIKIKTNPAWLSGRNAENPYNIMTKHLLEEFIAMGIEEGQGNNVFPEGNALKYFAEYFSEVNDFRNPYAEDPKNIKAISISANGDVLGGNINDTDIADIISFYHT